MFPTSYAYCKYEFMTHFVSGHQMAEVEPTTLPEDALPVQITFDAPLSTFSKILPIRISSPPVIYAWFRKSIPTIVFNAVDELSKKLIAKSGCTWRPTGAVAFSDDRYFDFMKSWVHATNNREFDMHAWIPSSLLNLSSGSLNLDRKILVCIKGEFSPPSDREQSTSLLIWPVVIKPIVFYESAARPQ
jgi:hypothetical protein